jgi:hypothetical protein
LRVVDNYCGADESLVEMMNHLRIGEQTCSQVRAAGSTTLVIGRPPGNESENGPALPARFN